MIAKFDSYRRFETPMLYVCNPGAKLQNNMLTNVIGILTDVSDLEFVPNFNATSMLNFRYYYCEDDSLSTTEKTYVNTIFRSLQNRRLIFADDIGFFVITGAEDGYDKTKGRYKDIEAESCEVELRSKGLPYIEDGTYRFYTGDQGDPGMIETLMSYVPGWSIGDIDLAVETKYRTFEDLDFTENILGFMLGELQDAYECIFVFDIMNRIVNIYDQANYVHTTEIHLTKDDFINSLNVRESSDDLYTALSVKGENELSINAVNPLGTSVVYNFDYYLSWMTPTLRSKVTEWQNLVAGYADEYYNIQRGRYGYLTELSTLEAELNAINTQLTMYKRCKENIVAEGSDEDIAEYNAVIESLGSVIVGIEDLLIPEDQGYLWIMYADDNQGTNITTDPYGKNYIGLAYDKTSNIASTNPSNYSWFQFRSGQAFPRTVSGSTVYTWIVYADSTTSGMSNNPDNKPYMGIALNQTSSTKSSNYNDYSWSLVDSGGIGVSEALAMIVDLVDQTETTLAAKQAEVNALNAILETQNARVSEIQAAVNIQTYFTSAQLEELSNYIIEGSYEDEYITITDSMTYEEQFDQMKTLYDRGVAQLEKASEPTQEFTIDVENFIFVKEFENWSNQLETGCLINVEVDDGDLAQLFLTSFSVNYEDHKLSMTFGNRYNRFDPQALFNKVLGNISKSSNTLSYIRNTLYPVKNGGFNAMKEALETSRTLTKNAVLSSTNEQVIIDDTGYTGRRVLPDGTVDPKQIKINGRNIVFTDDAWETCKTAIGEILLGDGASAYGVNAEVLMGNVIYGNQLHIINDDGNDMFQVTHDAVMVSVGDNFAAKEDTISGVRVMYCRATSETACNQSTIVVAWSTVAPAWVDGQYIWQKTVTTYDDGSQTESDPTCISGARGITGMSGSDGANGIGISSITPEYYLSTSSSTQSGGSWSTTPPTWVNGKYIWTRSHIYWDDGTDTTTSPVLDNSLNSLGQNIYDCRTDIDINKEGIRQNTQYYQQLHNQVSKINSYIQTGILDRDTSGKVIYGVKIGENLQTVNAYIRSGATALSASWLSETNGGSALTPLDSVIYLVMTSGSYYGKSYRWNGSAYEVASSEGTLSSVFTSSELGFYDTGTKTAYFSNKNLNVKTVRTEKILLSTDVISNVSSNNWQIGTDNGFYLKWIGT